MVTTKRGRNRNYLLMSNGKQVGEVWKMQGKLGFGVKLHGIYWRNGEPNISGGSTATSVRRLMDAAPLAERTLTHNVEFNSGPGTQGSLRGSAGTIS